MLENPPWLIGYMPCADASLLGILGQSPALDSSPWCSYLPFGGILDITTTTSSEG